MSHLREVAQILQRPPECWPPLPSLPRLIAVLEACYDVPTADLSPYCVLDLRRRIAELEARLAEALPGRTVQ